MEANLTVNAESFSVFFSFVKTYGSEAEGARKEAGTEHEVSGTMRNQQTRPMSDAVNRDI